MSESNMDNLLSVFDSALGSLIVEMNIEQNIALQKFICCDAAKSRMHSRGNGRLTIRHGAVMDRPRRPFSAESSKYRVYSRHCRRGDPAPSVNRDGHCRDGIKENVQTAIPARLVQGDSADTSCAIRMHEMNIISFL
jgi:hypothetical protein